jgi:hypothetical protein
MGVSRRTNWARIGGSIGLVLALRVGALSGQDSPEQPTQTNIPEGAPPTGTAPDANSDQAGPAPEAAPLNAPSEGSNEAAPAADGDKPPPDAKPTPAPDEPDPNLVAKAAADAAIEARGCESAECAAAPAPPVAAGRSAQPLLIWASTAWADALGPGDCLRGKLQGTARAIAIASTLKQSVALSGIGLGAAGTLGDHPLLDHAANFQAQSLARLLHESGFSAIGVGIADLSGPLLRRPQLTAALVQNGVQVIASNLECGNQAFCADWQTVEKPLTIIERDGQRYALISVLPDDALARTEPSGGAFGIRAAADTLIERTREARAAHVDMVVASIDHGPDSSIDMAGFVESLPLDARPDLVLSPSAAQNLLFLRPLNVKPAVVGPRAAGLTAVRATKIGDSDDSDILARPVKLGDPDIALITILDELGTSYCATKGKPLPGGTLQAPLHSAELVELAADTARQMAQAELAVVDPLVFDGQFSQPGAAKLQVGQVERAVLMDSPLVAANVPLDWIGNLNKVLSGPRPLVLFGAGVDHGDPTIGGRVQVTGVRYRIVTTEVLARSGRLPDGPDWEALDDPNATLRGALLAHLSQPLAGDPRAFLRDPSQRTQWIGRTDGQIQGNLTAVRNPEGYSEPTLQLNGSRLLGASLLVNLDADAPKFLFENAGQVAFSRDFATHTTSQDLVYLQSTYTYRGLWPAPLYYPHPFAEGYAETQFTQGTAPYRHFLLRPELGLRSIFSSVLSFKVSAGMQYDVFAPGTKVYPGFGAELLMKPWNTTVAAGNVHLEGDIVYFWNAPGIRDQQTLRGQIIAALPIVGPLQFTLSALASLRKDLQSRLGSGASIQAGLRLRFIERMVSE